MKLPFTSVSLLPGDIAFVDRNYECLNDRITTTDGTLVRRKTFRDEVIERDGHACVVTQEGEDVCDAAHLIPHSKGDEVRYVPVVSSYYTIII